MSIKAHFELMAEYNQSINQQFYQAAKQLSQQKLDQDMGAYDSSRSKASAQSLVGDIIWLKRFVNNPSNFSSLKPLQGVDTPSSLDQKLYDRFADMREARGEVDQIIRDLCKETKETDFIYSLSYNNSKGLPFEKNFGFLLQHFFNHQTHHRGQVSTLLFQQGIDVGVTDLLVKIQD